MTSGFAGNLPQLQFSWDQQNGTQAKEMVDHSLKAANTTCRNFKEDATVLLNVLFGTNLLQKVKWQSRMVQTHVMLPWCTSHCIWIACRWRSGLRTCDGGSDLFLPHLVKVLFVERWGEGHLFQSLAGTPCSLNQQEAAQPQFQHLPTGQQNNHSKSSAQIVHFFLQEEKKG